MVIKAKRVIHDPIYGQQEPVGDVVHFTFDRFREYPYSGRKNGDSNNRLCRYTESEFHAIFRVINEEPTFGYKKGLYAV